MSKERLTAWLTASERQWIRDEASRLRASENYVIRTMIREKMKDTSQLSHVIDTQESANV